MEPEALQALDLIHRLRKAQSHSFGQLYAQGRWSEARRAPLDVQMHTRGVRFWTLIIGNNDHPKAPLSGCVNDAIVMQHFLEIPRSRDYG